MVGKSDFYPYGQETPNNPQHDEKTVKFTGHQRDPHGLSDYMMGRTCLWPLRRFASVDPARDGWNLYAYTANNPIKFVDPDGKNPVLIALGIATGGVIFGPSAANAPESPDTPLVEAGTGIPLDVMAAEAAGGAIGSAGAALLSRTTGALRRIFRRGTGEALPLPRGARAVDDLISGSGQVSSSRRLLQLERSGGLDAATGAFDDLARQAGQTARTVQGTGGPVRIVDLPGGGTASLRGFSSGGRPTIQINRPGEIPVKIRY